MSACRVLTWTSQDLSVAALNFNDYEILTTAWEGLLSTRLFDRVICHIIFISTFRNVMGAGWGEENDRDVFFNRDGKTTAIGTL